MILPFGEIKLVLLDFVEITLLCRLIYHFIVDNRGAQIIDQVESINERTSEAGSKSKVTSICSNDIFAMVYNAIICRINILLYSIKLNTEFTNIFDC